MCIRDSNAVDYAFLYGQYNSSEKKFEEFAPEWILNDTNIASLTTKSITCLLYTSRCV